MPQASDDSIFAKWVGHADIKSWQVTGGNNQIASMLDTVV